MRGAVSVTAFIALGITLPGYASQTSQQPPLKRTVEVFRFGGIDAPAEYTWTNTPELVVARDGSIFARVQQDASIFAYRPDGTFIRNIGRKGEGPGEFQFAVAHGLLADTLWIGDFPTSRISRMHLNGKHITTSATAFPAADGRGTPVRVSAMMRGGYAAGMLPRKRQGQCEIGGIPVVIARLPRLAKHDTIAMVQPNNLSIPCIGDWAFQAVPHSPAVTFASDGSGIATLSWSDREPGRFNVTRRAPDGRLLWSRSMKVAREVEIPRSVRDSIVESILARAHPQIDAAIRDHRVTGSPKSLVERALDIPRYYPPVRRVLIGIDGTTWVEQSLDLAGGTWIVLDANGTMLFRVLLPADIIVHQASAADIWGVKVDSLGIASMLKHHIQN